MNCEGSRYSGSFAPSTELTCDPSLEFPKTFVQTPGALWRPHTSGGGFQSKQQVSLLTHSWTDTMPDLPRDKRNILNYNVYGSEETVAYLRGVKRRGEDWAGSTAPPAAC
ncbi:hypothetical protein GN956_G10247 [Arapaima gigas]